MSVDNVKAAIQQVQPHIFEYQDDPPDGETNNAAPANNWETSTRYIIIDPILRALGWDLSDPKQCVVEYRARPQRTRKKYNDPRVDYVLLDRRSRPIIAIEAKRIDVDSRDGIGLDQLDKYVLSLPTLRTAVLTNGQYWEIFVKDQDGQWYPDGNRPLGLHWPDIDSTAQRLYHPLAKANTRSATPTSRRRPS